MSLNYVSRVVVYRLNSLKLIKIFLFPALCLVFLLACSGPRVAAQPNQPAFATARNALRSVPLRLPWLPDLQATQKLPEFVEDFRASVIIFKG
jgi:hypothetical protein